MRRFNNIGPPESSGPNDLTEKLRVVDGGDWAAFLMVRIYIWRE
jgi:hypothetical protein